MSAEDSKAVRNKKRLYLESITYYRQYPDVFCEEYLGISLNIYQKVIIRAFFRFSFSNIVMSRGLGKSFMGVLCLAVYCLLYPGTKAGIIAPAFRQAKIDIQEKFHDELCNMSPALAAEVSDFVCSTQRAKVEFYCGSWIEGFPIGSDGARVRGARLHIVLIDEAAYVDKDIIDAVIKPMLICRRDYEVGKNMDEYEGNKVLMCSTASYRFNHLYELMVDYFKRMVEPDNTQYFAMDLDYRTGIRCQLFDEEIVKQQRAVMSDFQFQQEYLAEFPKLAEGAFIDFNLLQNCADLDHIETKGVANFQYIMSIDVARSEGQDNTIIYVFKLHWFSQHVEADLVYIKSLNGMEFGKQADNVRKILMKFPQITDIYMDTMTIGTALSDELAKDYFCIEDQKWYPPLIDRNDETAMKRIDATNGVPIIYGLKPCVELNHRFGFAVKVFVEKNWLHMYPMKVEEKRDLSSEESILLLESEDARKEILSIETKGTTGGWMQFKTTSKRKDRWSAMGMGLYGIQLLADEKFNKEESPLIAPLVHRR